MACFSGIMTDKMSADHIAITKVGDRNVSLRQVNEMIFKRINAELEKNNNAPLIGLASQYQRIISSYAYKKVWPNFYKNHSKENPCFRGEPASESELLDAGIRLYNYYSTLTRENDKLDDGFDSNGYVGTHKTPDKFNKLVTGALGDDAR